MTSQCDVYLELHRASSTQRSHFTLFIPNVGQEAFARDKKWKTGCKGTVIHVVGEPMIAGFRLEMKRNYECSTSNNLTDMILLGTTDVKNVFYPTFTEFATEETPRSALEVCATRIPPPPNKQNIRAPVDGVNTRRCQEWTMEYLEALVRQGLLPESAIALAQAVRDPPTHGIFGYR